ncbi:Spy/CpxP family protein refolding chaperone [Marinobacter sp.]|uniref:Spy/CpxP family protein refolding chaperone n=1 Tax=Marinobacter sp. TaxID=50741 RepID=UPI00384EA6E7
MKLSKLVGATILTLGLSLPVMAQQPPAQGDQVDQLAKIVGLTDEQQKEIRGILDDMQSRIQALQVEAQQLQQQLQGRVQPDFDEEAIRREAEELGELTGEISALSTLMQAKVDRVFTEEQREKLNQRMQQMQQQMQQMQQQQQQGMPQ